jgi:DNA-binding MarR family transcriptional regulator
MSKERKLTRNERLTWRSVFEAHGRVLRHIDDDLAAAELGSLTDYDVLYTLYLAADRRVRLSDLAAAALLSRSGISRLVDRLEAKQFLRREPCEDDRRGAFAHLTDEGVNELRRIWKVYSAGISRYFFSGVTPEETEAIGQVFGRVRDSLRSP